MPLQVHTTLRRLCRGFSRLPAHILVANAPSGSSLYRLNSTAGSQLPGGDWSLALAMEACHSRTGG